MEFHICALSTQTPLTFRDEGRYSALTSSSSKSQLRKPSTGWLKISLLRALNLNPNTQMKIYFHSIQSACLFDACYCVCEVFAGSSVNHNGQCERESNTPRVWSHYRRHGCFDWLHSAAKKGKLSCRRERSGSNLALWRSVPRPYWTAGY